MILEQKYRDKGEFLVQMKMNSFSESEITELRQLLLISIRKSDTPGYNNIT